MFLVQEQVKYFRKELLTQHSSVGVSGENSMLPLPRNIWHFTFSPTGKHYRAGKGVQNSIGSAQFHFKMTSFVSIPKNMNAIVHLKLAFEYMQTFYNSATVQIEEQLNSYFHSKYAINKTSYLRNQKVFTNASVFI